LLNNVIPSKVEAYQIKYYSDLLSKIKGNEYTHFFLIRGYKIPVFFIEEIKKLNPNIKCIMYQWDSNKNNAYFHLIDSFDKVLSFDIADCNTNEKIQFQQLFYTEDISRLPNSNINDYKYFCLSSFTMDRYLQTLDFVKFCDQNNLTYNVFCYIPKRTYLKLKYLKGINLNASFLSFKPMSRLQYLNILSKSETVVDLSHSTQTGLSMRIIEAVGAMKKIWTTNKSILKNPICFHGKVDVLDFKELKEPQFLEGNEIVESPSVFFIDNWIRDIFQ